MSDSTTEVVVGGVVLAVAAAFLFYAAKTTGDGTTSLGGTELVASFRAADGVSVGTDVRLAGVKIGTVSRLELNSDTYRADATLRLNTDIPIPDDSAVAISSEGLLGGNYVEIFPGGSLTSFEKGDAFTDTQGSVSLVGLLMKFVSGRDGK